MGLNFLTCAILIHYSDVFFKILCKGPGLSEAEVTEEKEQGENQRGYFLWIVFVFILFAFLLRY